MSNVDMPRQALCCARTRGPAAPYRCTGWEPALASQPDSRPPPSRFCVQGVLHALTAIVTPCPSTYPPHSRPAVTPLSANLPLRRLQPEAELKGAHCKQQENLQ